MTTMMNDFTFKPRARLLQLLGEQLIGNSRLAVFELVKNAYDADAAEVNIVFDLLDDNLGQSKITVQDDGTGMSLDVIQKVWLEPGADNRKRNGADDRSPLFKRTPLGEKGVGRFAVHKLGNKIKLITKTPKGKAYQLEIDWDELLKNTYMEDAAVVVEECKNPPSSIAHSGTIIEISSLKNPWSQADIKNLYRNILSIQSPFETPKDLLGPTMGSFKVNIDVPSHHSWLKKLPSIDKILPRAFYKFKFHITNGKIDYSYEFIPPEQIKKLGVEGRSTSENKAPLPIAGRTQKVAVADTHKGIGDISGEFYVYAFDQEAKPYIEGYKELRDYLKENGGIRVYRDGIRVYNYGESGDDWLELDSKRVKHFGSGINRALVLGAVNLSLINSPELIEKTSREGFTENEAYENFKALVGGAIAVLTREREPDKARLKQTLTGDIANEKLNPVSPIHELKALLEKLPDSERYIPYILKAEVSINHLRDVMAESGTRGINMAILFHEFEKFVERFVSAFEKATTKEELVKNYEEARRMAEIMEEFGLLAKKGSVKTQPVNKSIKAALSLKERSIIDHGIEVTSPLTKEGAPDYIATFSASPLIGSLLNIIDNALYWLQIKWPDEATERKVYIGPAKGYDAPAIVIADNGPGFKMDPAELLKPFVSTKPDGESMGLGLYYAHMVMQIIEGEVILDNAADVDGVPDGYQGGAVILLFKKELKK